MSKKEPAGRLARWALKLQEFQIEIACKSGKSIQNADCLSRNPVNSVEYVFTDNSLTKIECKQVENHGPANIMHSVDTVRKQKKYRKSKNSKPVIIKKNKETDASEIANENIQATPEFITNPLKIRK